MVYGQLSTKGSIVFSAIKNTYKKSEAAVVVQKLLEQVISQFPHMNWRTGEPAAEVANVYVGALFTARPDMVNGHYGVRPHKVTFAAASIACGLVMTQNSEQLAKFQQATYAALCIILGHTQSAGSLYKFNSVDSSLLEYASAVLGDFSEQASSTPLAGQLAGIGLMD